MVSRFAHSNGHTIVCFADKNGFITTGEDGDVNVQHYPTTTIIFMWLMIHMK